MSSNRIGYVLAAILLVGLGLRVLLFLQFSATPFATHPTLDCAYYHQMAQEVAGGGIVQDRAFFLGPFYPYLLGAFYAFLGSHFWVAPVLQMILGLLTCWLIYRIGLRLFTPAVGVVAAFLYAAYKPVLFYEQTLLMETTLAFVFTLLLLIIVDHGRAGRPLWWLLIGILVGIAALFRGNALLFLPVLIFWLVRMESRAEGFALRRLLAPRVLLLVAGTILAILPATAHNHLAERDLVLISSNDGINLFIGNNAHASGCFDPPPGVEMGSDMPGVHFAQYALGRSPLTSSEVASFWRSRAFDYMAASPLRVLLLLVRKAYYFWGTVELDQVFIVEKMGALMPVLRWPLLTFTLLGPLALVGLAVQIRRKDGPAILMWFTLCYFVSLLPFFMTSRYRIPVIPVLSLFAAFFLVRLFDFLRQGRRRSLTGHGLVALALVFLLNDAWALPKRQVHETFHNSLGLIYLSERKFDLAQREFETALEAGVAPEIYGNLALVHFNKKDFPRAVRYFKEAYALNPANPQTCFRLGLACFHLKEFEEARRYLEESIALNPNGEPACYYYLAAAEWSLGKAAAAQRALRGYLQRNPGDVAAQRLLQQYMGQGE